MAGSRLRRHFVAVMAKHLPPSASTLRLLDLDGFSGAQLAEARADLEIRPVAAKALDRHDIKPDSVDAVVACDVELSDRVLHACFLTLRAGGRFIAVQSRETVSEARLRQLRAVGYARILIEPALDELGVLIRGEKPHDSPDTVERIGAVADGDADSLDLTTYRRPYVHLLIQQRPNKPVWKLAPGEAVSWRAAALAADSAPQLLGFSSLPKAVGFLQRAVLAGFSSDINKVGKFSRATIQAEAWEIRLNPTLDSLAGAKLIFVDVEPALAEAPDE